MDEEYPLEGSVRLPEFYHPAASSDGEKVAFYWDRSGRDEGGKDFEYRELNEEVHGSTDVNQKIRVFKILDDYLKRRL